MGCELYADNTQRYERKANKAPHAKKNFKKDGNIYTIVKGESKTKQKGDRGYPLRKLEEVTAVIEYYENKANSDTTTAGYRQLYDRNKLLMILGFNVGVRASDLCKIKWCNVYDSDGNFLEPENEEMTERRTNRIEEQKTNKIKDLIFNDVVREAFEYYVEKYDIDKNSDDYVFFNRQDTHPHIGVEQVSKIIKKAVTECGIRRRVASHTLRTTFSLFQMLAHQDDASFTAELMDILNHDSEKTTLHYVGLDVDKKIQYHNDVQLGKVSVIRNHKKIEVNHEKELIVDKSDMEYLLKQLSEKCYTCNNDCNACYNAILAKKYGYDLNIL